MLLFIDESGHDMRESPYYVLAGITVAESRLWNFTQAILELEHRWFGIRLRDINIEVKGSIFLKRKVFKFSSQRNFVHEKNISRLAKNFLTKGYVKEQDPTSDYHPTANEFKAFGLASKRFINQLLELCVDFDVKAFASLVKPQELIEAEGLRKDYGYLFERYDNYLRESDGEVGLVVFDELEKSQSHMLLQQIRWYFTETNTGQNRAERIVPEPFFVHSDLTKCIQVADVLAYVLNWGLRLEGMNKPTRKEIEPYADRAFKLNYHGQTVNQGKSWPLYGFKYIEDLRTRDERDV